MQSPSFESLISPPWPEKEENSFYGDPCHLDKELKQQPTKTEKGPADDGLDHVAILGYN